MKLTIIEKSIAGTVTLVDLRAPPPVVQAAPPLVFTHSPVRSRQQPKRRVYSRNMSEKLARYSPVTLAKCLALYAARKPIKAVATACGMSRREAREHINRSGVLRESTPPVYVDLGVAVELFVQNVPAGKVAEILGCSATHARRLRRRWDTHGTLGRQR